MLWLTVLLLSGPSSFAQIYRGSVSSAMGGTGRAALDVPEGVFLNPALVTLFKNYVMAAYYSDGSLDPGLHHHAVGVGAGDNTDGTMFPGAVHYMRLRDTGVASSAVDGEFWHAAIGKNFLRRFAVGASGYRLSSTLQDGQQFIQWNTSLGGLFMITRDMGVAYALSNLANAGSDVPTLLRQDMQQGIGYFATLGELARIRVDLSRMEQNNPDQKMVYMLGLENITGSFMLFRCGYRLDDQRGQRYITAGLSFDGPRLKVDYSFEKNLQGTAEALHSVDLNLPF